jgi:predicted nuclease with RNAse H fold
MWAQSGRASTSRSSMIAGFWRFRGHLTCRQVVDIVLANRPVVVAIDSPGSCAPDGQSARDGELRLARSICGIRWTPDAGRVQASAYYAWILEGHALFDALAVPGVEVIEVFPTASWTGWHGKRGSRTRAAWTRQGLAALSLECARAHESRPARCSRRCDDGLSAQPGPDRNDGRYRRSGQPLVTCEAPGRFRRSAFQAGLAWLTDPIQLSSVLGIDVCVGGPDRG